MTEKRRARREQWRQMIGEQEKSRVSVRAFCRERGVSEFSFYSWRKRLLKERAVSFALVDTAQSSDTAPLELILTSGDRLRIPGNPAALRMVMSVLREGA
jgi:Transposase